MHCLRLILRRRMKEERAVKVFSDAVKSFIIERMRVRIENGEFDKYIEDFARGFLRGENLSLSITFTIDFLNNDVFFMRKLLGLDVDDELIRKLWMRK